MADRNFYPNSLSLEVDHVSLWAQIVIGSGGAVTSSSGLGILTVVKESAAGQYTITLTDSYNKLLWAGCTLLSTTDGAQTIGTAFRINSENVDDAAAPVLVIQCSDTATGADANLTSGDILYVKIELRNSSVTNT
tara:strand:+ start:4389 stop:4793 length:405 start_codon:yes stop_codon:yes gene_type:complete